MKPYRKTITRNDGSTATRWYVKYYWKGQGHFSKPFDTEAEANTFCKVTALDLSAAKASGGVPHCIQSAARKPTPDTSIKSCTADRFIEECMTFKAPDLAPQSIRAYRTAYSSFREIVPFHHIGEVTAQAIQKYKTGGRLAGLAPTTIANRLVALRVLFNWGVKHRYLSESPFPERMKRDPSYVANDPKVYLTNEELNKLIQCAADFGPDILWLILLCGLSGMRLNEALNAKYEWVNLTGGFLGQGGSITVQSGHKFQTKNRKSRTITLHQTLRIHLDVNMPQTGYIIKPGVTEWTNYRWTVAKPLQTVLKAAGLEYVDRGHGKKRVGCHTLRHTFASLLAQSGETTYTIMTLCGHSSERVSQGYMHLAPGKKMLDFGTVKPTGGSGRTMPEVG